VTAMPARLGLLGGMSWQSTSVYYRLLNELVQQRLGGHASAPVTVFSVDFAEVEALQRAGDWQAQGALLNRAALALQASGVQLVALATNTLHLVAEQITAGLTVPFIDLVDVVGESCADRGFRTVGLLGTGYTMTSGLYPSRLERFGTRVLIPPPQDCQDVHEIIYDELVHGVFSEPSRRRYLAIVAELADAGAEAVVLGCTEIGLLLPEGSAVVPLIDTTALHCQALVTEMLKGSSL
jgi:aspartate racemase